MEDKFINFVNSNQGFRFFEEQGSRRNQIPNNISQQQNQQETLQSSRLQSSISENLNKSKLIQNNNSQKQQNQDNSNNIDEILNCFICMGRLQNAHMCPHCSKMCCELCIKRWLDQKNECPHCRAHLRQQKLVPCRFVSEITHAIEYMKINEKTSEEYCDEHQDNKMQYYCKDCQVPICSDCAMFGTTHKSHQFEKITKIYDFHFQKVKKEMDILSSRLNELIEQRIQVEENIELMNKQKKERQDELKHFTEQTSQKIENDQKNLVVVMLQTKKGLNEEIELLDQMKEELEKQIYQAPKSIVIQKSDEMVQMIQELNKKGVVDEVAKINFEKKDLVSEIVPDYSHSVFILDNFKEKKQKIDEIVYSKPLYVYGIKWRLKVYPNGNGAAKNNYLSIFLEMTDGHPESQKYEYRIEMINQRNPEVQVTREFASDFESGECWGYNRFFKIDLLETEGYLLPQEDKLIFKFHVRCPNYKIQSNNQKRYIEELQKNQKELEQRLQMSLKRIQQIENENQVLRELNASSTHSQDFNLPLSTNQDLVNDLQRDQIELLNNMSSSQNDFSQQEENQEPEDGEENEEEINQSLNTYQTSGQNNKSNLQSVSNINKQSGGLFQSSSEQSKNPLFSQQQKQASGKIISKGDFQFNVKSLDSMIQTIKFDENEVRQLLNQNLEEDEEIKASIQEQNKQSQKESFQNLLRNKQLQQKNQTQGNQQSLVQVNQKAQNQFQVQQQQEKFSVKDDQTEQELFNQVYLKVNSGLNNRSQLESSQIQKVQQKQNEQNISHGYLEQEKLWQEFDRKSSFSSDSNDTQKDEEYQDSEIKQTKSDYDQDSSQKKNFGGYNQENQNDFDESSNEIQEEELNRLMKQFRNQQQQNNKLLLESSSSTNNDLPLENMKQSSQYQQKRDQYQMEDQRQQDEMRQFQIQQQKQMNNQESENEEDFLVQMRNEVENEKINSELKRILMESSSSQNDEKQDSDKQKFNLLQEKLNLELQEALQQVKPIEPDDFFNSESYQVKILQPQQQNCIPEENQDQFDDVRQIRKNLLGQFDEEAMRSSHENIFSKSLLDLETNKRNGDLFQNQTKTNNYLGKSNDKFVNNLTNNNLNFQDNIKKKMNSFNKFDLNQFQQQNANKKNISQQINQIQNQQNSQISDKNSDK